MRYLINTVFMMAFLLLMSCGGQEHHEDLHIKLKEIRSKPGRPIGTVPKYQPVAKYRYPTSAKNRDPFYSSLQARLAKQKNKEQEVGAPDFKRVKQPLELFPLDALTMVGHLKEDGRIWGLVVAPNHIIYRVTIGMYMGKHFGRVSGVHEGYISLVEMIKDGNKWKKRNIKVELIKNKVDRK